MDATISRLNTLGVELQGWRNNLSSEADEALFRAELRSTEYNVRLDLNEFWLHEIKKAIANGKLFVDNRSLRKRNTGPLYQAVLKEFLETTTEVEFSIEEVKPLFFGKPYLRVSWKAT